MYRHCRVYSQLASLGLYYAILQGFKKAEYAQISCAGFHGWMRRGCLRARLEARESGNSLQVKGEPYERMLGTENFEY
jgi:hypothetical protein